MFTLLLSTLLFVYSALFGATGFEGRFEEYQSRQIELAYRYLPEKPVLVEWSSQREPANPAFFQLVSSQNLDSWCEEEAVSSVDLLYLDLDGYELAALQNSPRSLETIQAILTKTHLFALSKEQCSYKELREFLERSGFKMVAHWYGETLEGSALFVKRELTHGKLPSERN